MTWLPWLDEQAMEYGTGSLYFSRLNPLNISGWRPSE
ncbi:hypothetical protein ABIE35_003749 [Paenarthrobacter sp. 4246]